MKVFATLFAAVVLAAAFAGCTMVTCTERNGSAFNNMSLGEGNAKPIAQATVQIDGLYLFGAIPIVSGGSENGKMAWFNDTVNTDNAVAVIAEKLRGRGGNRLVNLQSACGSYPLVFTFCLLSYREVTASASTIK